MSAIDFEKDREERYNHHLITGGPAQGGLTLLDVLAAEAMNAVLTRPDLDTMTAAEVSDLSYGMAQAMLEKRAEILAPKNQVTGITGKTYG